MKKHAPPPLPQRADGLALAALLFAALSTLAAYGATSLVRSSLEFLGVMQGVWQVIFWITIAATALLFIPALRSYAESRKAAAALAAGDIVEARIQTAASRENGWVTFGWGAFALIALGFAVFVMMNDVAVGKTFFYLPLMQQKWWLVTKQFFLTNIFIFIIAEVLVLVWGLVVALARLMPGKAGQPIRALAILYCDIFRGLPAVVTLYLIGFGIPTSGLPEMIVPHVVAWFVDLSSMSVAEQRSLTRIPVIWWCILALTLTYGAYVAEVYRSGIESIHWSQVSAARSLGLSYMQTMRYVVVPQAVRRIIAPLLNDFIGLQKDTALVSILGVVETFKQAQILKAASFNFTPLMTTAIIFLVITIPMTRLVDHLAAKDRSAQLGGTR